jgi:AraC-like DNA-binding protein
MLSRPPRTAVLLLGVLTLLALPCTATAQQNPSPMVEQTRAHERLAPEGLARLLALPRRTVSDRLAASGFPAPQQLLAWGRLIVAAHLLEDAHRSADRIAAALDFPSGSAFRNACQRYLAATPSEIRQRGGAAYVIRGMLQGQPRLLSLFDALDQPARGDQLRGA